MTFDLAKALEAIDPRIWFPAVLDFINGLFGPLGAPAIILLIGWWIWCNRRRKKNAG